MRFNFLLFFSPVFVLMRVDRDDDDEDGDDDDDEEEVMTEAERMEEGRRMFQIFAARMFEQRVLTAYREKVSPSPHLIRRT